MPTKPANQDMLSFLNLPPEIRNWVYEIFFRHPDPLFLADTGGNSVTLFKSWAYRNHALEECPRRASKQSMTPQRCGITYSCLDGAFQPGIQLLRVCRQIHTEAASVLYSNKFHIVPYTHPQYHDTTGHYMNNTSCTWLRNIGRQHMRFVRRLSIDLGSICILDRRAKEPDELSTVRSCDGYIRFGALLRGIVWPSRGRIAVTLLDPKPPRICRDYLDLEERTSSYIHSYEISTSQLRNVERLNAVFQALCMDVLGMKKFKRTILDVGIKPDGSSGVFIFRRTIPSLDDEDVIWSNHPKEPYPFLDHARYFSTKEHGTPQFIVPTPRRLLALPRSVLIKIMKHTLYSSSGYEIDLDSCDGMKALCGILYFNKNIHDKYMQTFLQNTFHISITSTNTHASLTKLARLLETKFEYRADLSDPINYLHFGTSAQYSITIHISSATASLSTIRINLMSLVAATLSASAPRPVRIMLHTGGTTRTKLQATSIRTLRQILLKALTKYVKFDCQYSRARCPEVWINGYGTVAEVVETGVVDGLGARDLTREYCTLWSEEQIRGVEPDFEMPSERDTVRKMYLWLKWVVMRDEGKGEL
jgi:hypothetical protein